MEKLKKLLAKKSSKLIIRILITLVLITILTYTIGAKNIFNSLIHVKITPLAIAWAFGIFIHYLEASQMKRLMQESGMEISTGRAFLAGSLSALYGLIIPGDILAGAAKWANLSAAVGEKAGVFNSIVYRRVIILLPEIFVGLIAFWINNPTDNKIFPVVMGILSAFVFIFSILFYHPYTGQKLNDFACRFSTSIFPERISKRIQTVLSSLKNFYMFSWRFHLGMLLRSLLIMLVGYLNFYFSTRSVGINLPILVIIWVKSIIVIARQLPISISGLGVRESILVGALSLFGVPEAVAFSLGILRFTNIIIYGLIGAGYQISLTFGWVKWNDKKPKAK